jgi:hypothetical protein
MQMSQIHFSRTCDARLKSQEFKSKKENLKMKTKLFTLFVLLIGLAVVSTGCGSEAAQASTDVPPEKVVESFYEWYLGYIGDRASDEMRNPLVDGAYRSSEYLSEAFVQKVDDLLASFEHGGYDPFLCAQDIPESISADKAMVSGDAASVMVHTSFAGHSLQVDLQQFEGQWKISDIICR